MFKINITKKQKAVLKNIHNFIIKNSYPPTVREIAEIMGFSSPKAASDHIKALEKKGYITRNSLARSIKLTKMAMQLVLDSPAIINNSNSLESTNPNSSSMLKKLAVLGRIAAGNPILAEENIENYIPLPPNFLEAYNADFALKVKGDSMVGDHILDGDIIIVRSQSNAENGDIIVALLEENSEKEAVVKRFYKINKNEIELRSSNPNYPPIKIKSSENFKILGKVVAVYRSI